MTNDLSASRMDDREIPSPEVSGNESLGPVEEDSEPPFTVATLIEKLQEFEPTLPVVLASEGRYVWNEEPTLTLGTRADLYRGRRRDRVEDTIGLPPEQILIIE